MAERVVSREEGAMDQLCSRTGVGETFRPAEHPGRAFGPNLGGRPRPRVNRQQAMTDDPRPSRPDVKGPDSQGPDPRDALRRKTIVLVGLMGVGKSSVGRRLAATLNLPFRDADNEVEAAAGRSIPEIFAEMGEPAFRDGERRVIARLLDEPPHVLATGGGAFVNAETRALIKSKAIAVWLKADLELLARRVGRKEGRPLLRNRDPMEVLR